MCLSFIFAYLQVILFSFISVVEDIFFFWLIVHVFALVALLMDTGEQIGKTEFEKRKPHLIPVCKNDMYSKNSCLFLH